MKKTKISALVLALTIASTATFSGCAARRPNSPGDLGYQNGTGSYGNSYYGNIDNYRDRYGNRGIAEDYNNIGYYNNTSYNTNNRLGNNYLRNTNMRMGAPATQTDRIALAVQRVPGVRNCSVVVSENIAYIGLDINTAGATDSTARIQQIKKRCANVARANDKGINQVVVSADADFMQRLQNISQGIKSGTPAESFKNELNQMIKRVTPERQ